jgi:hypothetical protein
MRNGVPVREHTMSLGVTMKRAYAVDREESERCAAPTVTFRPHPLMKDGGAWWGRGVAVSYFPDHDNNPENIEVMKSRAHHLNKHRTVNFNGRLADEPNPRIACACGCGKRLDKFDHQGRPRRYFSGHNTAERNRAWAK